jgi:hypothetical protein
MDFFETLWVVSLILFIAGPSAAGIAYKKEKITAPRALIAGFLALTISAILSWAVVLFL